MKVATFILLADPQTGWYGSIPEELDNLTMLNTALNNIAKVKYPTDPKIGYISCSGPIGKPDAVFFAGDLTNYGGQFNVLEHDIAGNSEVATNIGGMILNEFRVFYDSVIPKYDPYVRLTECGPLYFGLGNHDVSIQDDPPASYRWLGFNHEPVGTNADYYRYQMWNFINQMHVGYNRPLNGIPVTTKPRFPIPPSSIDADPNGTFYFQSSSFNYVIDLGPLDVYQLHLFGGDATHGRKSGIDWLKRQLALRGYSRPFFVIQHLPLQFQNDRSKRAEGMWNDTARDELLAVLKPYSLLGFGVGHLHWEGLAQMRSADGATNTKEFMMGAAADRYFGVVRVEQEDDGAVRMNVVWGFVEKTGKVKWDMGWGQTMGKRDVWVGGVEVVRLNDPVNDWSRDLPHYVTEEAGKSADINDGCGQATYLKPILTNDVNQAITGFDFLVQDDPIPSMQGLDLADPYNPRPCMVKQHRYLVPKRESGQPPIKQLFLWRADGKQAPRIGWKLSPNLDEGRGGNGLFLEWEVGCN